MSLKPLLVFCAVLALLLECAEGRAVVLQPSPSLAHEILSESVPSAFAPNDFDTPDFSVEWTTGKVEGVEVTIGRGTLEWVRVSEVLVLPRARLLVSVHDVEAGRLTNAGFSVPLTVHEGRGVAELPIALISGSANPVYVSIRRGGKEYSGQLEARLHARKPLRREVDFDASCSRFGLSAKSVSLPASEWVFVGCRNVSVEGVGHRTSSLELYVFWEGVGQTIDVGGIETPATMTSTWLLRLASSPGQVALRAGDSSVTLSYHTPEYLHYAALGLGIGPYHYTFQGPTETTVGYVPVVTLYGSYFVTETLRIVIFDATSISPQILTDFGIYANTESFRFLDRRMAVNLLLGGHVNGFRSGGDYYLKIGLPQGIEGTFIDAFKPGFNMSFGAFIYPPINDKSYYNLWFRWGTPRIFGEVNYISWQEKLSSSIVYTQTFGLSLGLSLIRFL